MLTTSARFGFSKLDRTQKTQGHLMVTLRAEDQTFHRTPLALALVLDVSGSMQGPKIAALQSTAAKLVQHLTDKDEIAIVTYESFVTTLQKRVRLVTKEMLLGVINGLQSGSSTNLSGGLTEGFSQLAADFAGGVRRVLLLTDGLPNLGVSDRPGLLRLVENRPGGVTLSTFGFGTDCDHELLADMARAGGGNHYFIDKLDTDLVFARELGGLAACQAQNLKVIVEPGSGVTILEVLNDYTVEQDGESAVVLAEDIYAGETKQILIKLEVTPPEKPKDRDYSIAHVKVPWQLVDGSARQEDQVNVKVKFVKPGEADTQETLDVAEQVAALRAARAQAEAVRQAEAGNFAAAQHAVRTSLDYLKEEMARGSKLAGALSSRSPSPEQFVKEQYSKLLGANVASNAAGALKQRVAGGGGIAEVYSTDRSEKMVESFQKPPSSEAQQPVTASPAATDDPGPSGSSFSKSRSRKY